MRWPSSVAGVAPSFPEPLPSFATNAEPPEVDDLQPPPQQQRSMALVPLYCADWCISDHPHPVLHIILWRRHVIAYSSFLDPLFLSQRHPIAAS